MDDLEELVRFYLDKNSNRYLNPVGEISPEALRLLQHYLWPGNVRELFNILDYVMNTVEGGRIEVMHLPRHLQRDEEGRQERGPLPYGGPETPPVGTIPVYPLGEGGTENGTADGNLDGLLRAVEKRAIEEALARCRYRLNRTAVSLGVSRQTLQYRIRKLGIEL
ncbi:hypothetical protein LJC23_06000 [Desulfovibrio sp. OttesenSCG-928-I05]|nr:hypothetical protein [Desulfovibrio sp. OttesenSCG-928-I05]